MNQIDPSKDSKQQERVQKSGGDTATNPYNERPTVMPSVGDKLGSYIIQSLIGEGGSANVFKAWHEELEVVRAVKILKSGYKSDARERFFTEAKILADIRHPNIITIYNIGYTSEQVPYLELEYIDGASIKDLITERGKMPFAAALSFAYFICQALRYAHSKDYALYGKAYKGMIHRDVKPENILISRDGSVKLMDFGIARPSEVSLHTVGTKVMGTLVYLSPEQLGGGALDHRSDIFSLGTVLYEMITGHRAFPQKTLTELVQKKTVGQYRPLSGFGMEFPKCLATVVEKSMRLHPDERYGSAEEMGYEIYDALKEISDLPPYDIAARYMRDPKSIQRREPLRPPNDFSNRRQKTITANVENKAPLPWVMLVGAATAGIVAGGIIALLFLR